MSPDDIHSITIPLAVMLLLAHFAPVPDRCQSLRPRRRANRLALVLFALTATAGLLVKYLG